MPKAQTRTRDAAATRARILEAAKQEFARLGLGGARVDEIAERASANKRMIYHYFGSKEDLFQTVLEEAYLDIRNAEQALRLDHLPPRDALARLVSFTWNYYLDNPEFIRLVNSENMHEARHIRQSERLREPSRRFTRMVGDILDRGVAEGVFRPGIDPVQLNLTIAAIGYFYLTNRHTGSFLYERDFMSEDELAQRLEFNLETALRLVSADGAEGAVGSGRIGP